MPTGGVVVTSTTEVQAPATIGLHVYKTDGYWTIERLRNGEVVEVYVGVLSLADALDRIGDWMRAV